jgi:hypothetical protein
MYRKPIVISTLLVSMLGMTFNVVAGPLGPPQPNFVPALYADGEFWGTKATTLLPAPNDRNIQSFDKLFVVTNGAVGQLPVTEAAPGNRQYNGGR